MQAKTLEGVGDKTETMFHKFIMEREEEYKEAQENIPGFEEDKNYLSLAQKILSEDHEMRAKDLGKNGLFKRRKLGEGDNDGIGVVDKDALKAGTRKRKNLEGFLDIGSSSWSMFIACYFMSFHKGAYQEAVVFNKKSIENMLTIISRQVAKNIPLERKFDTSEFERIVENDLLTPVSGKEGDYCFTEKGLKRGAKV